MVAVDKLGDAGLFNASFSSASSLITLQLFSRLCTFVLNQGLLRMASPKAFGTAAIQFELLLSTILFLSREGVRGALVRAWSSGEARRGSIKMQYNKKTIANLALLPAAFGIPLASVTSLLYVRFVEDDTSSQSYFGAAIVVYALAALVELLNEPMYTRAMGELKTGIRVRAEALGITCKAVVTFIVLMIDSRQKRNGEYALLAFAAGQMAYAVFVLLVYLRHFGKMSFWLERIENPDGKAHGLSAYFDLDLLSLSITMVSQSMVKHFLTEGDKLILSRLSPLRDQGGYAIALNYGSLIARIVFQPIEETSRVFFSKLLAKSMVSRSESSRQALSQAADALTSLLMIQVSFTAILLVFGIAYLPIALHILLPPQYLSTSAPQVLSAWIWYIPVLAVNGGLEAFLSTVATPTDLNRQSRWMVAFSMIYIATALLLYRLGFGDISLVYANIINLSARIIYCSLFISSYFRYQHADDLLNLTTVLPTQNFLLASLTSALLIRFSDRRLHVTEMVEARGTQAVLSPPVIIHVAFGGLLALVTLGTWWVSIGRFLTIPGRLKSE